MKFDGVIGNPPYNAKQEKKTKKKGGGDLLWNKFVEKSLKIWLQDDGYLLYVHPAGWRKPNSEHSKYHLFDLMTKENQMIYLEIHDTIDGMKIFNCGTRYDWYLIQRREKYSDSKVKDEKHNFVDLDLSKWNWLPNYYFNKIDSLLVKNNEQVVNIMFSTSSYETRKNWMSSIKTEEYKYECIHSTPKKGIRYYYSNCNNKGHFGISKVIFGESGIYNSIVDKDGIYGMTQHAIAISDTIENLELIKSILDSKEFKIITDACSWSNYAIDWRMFLSFKKDFWKFL